MMSARMKFPISFFRRTPRRCVRAGDARSEKLPRGDSGAVTVVFAMCAGLMMVTMAMALDSIQGAMANANLISAEDATALSGSLDSSRYPTTTGSDLANWQQDVQAYFRANMPNGAANFSMPDSSIVATMTDAPGGGRIIKVSASGTLRFLLPINLPWVGGSSPQQEPATIQLAATDAALYVPKSTLELVMVLDNTGSMADSVNGVSKMDGLKSAANTMVSDIFAQTNADSYIGIVPFTTTVNVTGALPANGNWLSPVFSYNPNGVQMAADTTHAGWGGCAVEPRDGNGYMYPQAYSPASSMKFTPYYYNVPPAGLSARTFKNSCTSASTVTQVIQGLPFPTLKGGLLNACSATPPGTGIATTYDTGSGLGSQTVTVSQNTDCISNPVTFLTQNQSTLTTAISRMSPSGSTIIPTGILWGWRMLSSAWSGNVAPGSGWISNDNTLPRPETTLALQRVMVVLTDGENQVGGAYSLPNDLYFNGLTGVGSKAISAPTVARSDGTGSLANGTMDYSEVSSLPASGQGYSNDVNSFQLGVCTAIKNSGVTIYAITFGSVSSTAAATMSACATSGDYYHAPDGPTLDQIFQQIAGSLGVLRLTQ